jgi:hypothetical protein
MQTHLHIFVRRKYTTFSSIRIVALQSVNKIFRRATISQLIITYSRAPVHLYLYNSKANHCILYSITYKGVQKTSLALKGSTVPVKPVSQIQLPPVNF